MKHGLLLAASACLLFSNCAPPAPPAPAPAPVKTTAPAKVKKSTAGQVKRYQTLEAESGM